MEKRFFKTSIFFIIMMMISVTVWKYYILENEKPDNKNGNALDIKTTVDNSMTAKRNAFVVEVQAISKQGLTDYVSDSLMGVEIYDYCQAGLQSDKVNYDITDCKGLNFDTNYGYHVKYDKSGKTLLLVVYNDLYYCVFKSDEGINFINVTDDDVKEIKKIGNGKKLIVSTGEIN